MIKNMTFGALLRDIRIKNGKTLRGYCRENDFDCSNISKLETNLISPPNTSRQLSSYLKGLKFSPLDYDFLLVACVNYHVSKIHDRFGLKDKGHLIK